MARPEAVRASSSWAAETRGVITLVWPVAGRGEAWGPGPSLEEDGWIAAPGSNTVRDLTQQRP